MATKVSAETAPAVENTSPGGNGGVGSNTGDDPNIESSAAASSSYANVVHKLKPTAQESIRNDNNKENIGETNHSDANSVSVVTTATSSSSSSSTGGGGDGGNVEESDVKGEVTTAKSTDADNENDDYEDEDDSSFTPVVSHNRKDRRAKRRMRDRQSTGPGGGGSGKAINGASRGGVGTTVKDKDKRKTSKDGKRVVRNKSSEAYREAENTVPNTKTPNNTSDEQESEDGTAKKFVDAPLPKVNAWKVRVVI